MGNQEDRKIARLLLTKGISWNDMSDSRKELARKVYRLCSAKLENLAELNEQIKQLKFNKRSIAAELGMDHKTLGTNNPEVSAIQDILIEEGKKHWSNSMSSERNTIAELNEEIKLLYERDIELIKMDIEIRKKDDEIKARERQYEDMKTQRDEWKQKYEDLFFQTSRGVQSLGGNKNDGLKS